MLASILLGNVAISPIREVDPAKVLHVYADSALKEGAARIERQFEAANPGYDVRLTTGSSAKLSETASTSAYDLYLVAGDSASVQKASGLAPRIFANTTLALITAADQTSIHALTELAQAESVVMVKSADPSHRYVRRLFAQAAQAYGKGWLGLIERHLTTDAADTRAVMAKVGAGEAAAGFVYATDARAYSKVRSVPIPPGLNMTVTFSAVIGRGSKNREGASRLSDFLFSKSAQSILKARGFTSPLTPTAELPVLMKGELMRLFVTKLNALPQKSVRVDGRTYRGADLGEILKSAKGKQVRFAGADGLTVTVSLAALRAGSGVLYRMPDGNLQAVLPGEPRTRWVRWVRSIQIL